MDTSGEIKALWRLLRERRPLVHMIPNGVSAALCADAMAAAGARPVMAGSAAETAEITAHADALAANLGQPSPEKEAALRASLTAAAEKGVPAVFDPVGAGASAYRRELSRSLLEIPWKGVLKCNASELHTLHTGQLAHEGVDAVRIPDDAREADLSAFPLPDGRALAVTGKEDLLRQGGRRILLSHSDGHFINLVGTGCAAGALCACFCAVTEDYFLAALAALSLTSAALDLASEGSPGYGSVKTRFLDALSDPSLLERTTLQYKEL